MPNAVSGRFVNFAIFPNPRLSGKNRLACCPVYDRISPPRRKRPPPIKSYLRVFDNGNLIERWQIPKLINDNGRRCLRRRGLRSGRASGYDYSSYIYEKSHITIQTR